MTQSIHPILAAATALMIVAACAPAAPVAPQPDPGAATEAPGTTGTARGSATGTATGTATEAPAAPETVPEAREMTLTTYDDGRSCPAGCDSHVVFKAVHNGTVNAFAPAPGADPFASRTAPDRRACVRGEACAICFGPPRASCMVTTYRGSGPAEGRFDVTPAFLKEWCPRAEIPAVLRQKCMSHMQAAATLAARTNCIADPAAPACAATMAAAVADKSADLPEFEQCHTIGESAYNAAQTDPLKRRTHACAYFANRRHPTGEWLLLTPGACREGFFVGRDGLDCCSADPVQAAIDPVECGIYYR